MGGENHTFTPMSKTKRMPSLDFTRPNLSDAVANYLREVILRGEFGDKLPGERPLAETLKVSRTSLRMALDLLTAEGLIDRRHGCTTRVVTKKECALAA